MNIIMNRQVAGLLEKFRSGDMTSEELQDLKSLMDTTSDQELRDILMYEWDKFDHYSPLPDEKVEKLYEKMNIKGGNVHRNRVSLKNYWMQIAASILFIIAGGLTVLTYMQNKTISSLAEQNVVIRSGDYGKSLVTLPDGTIVYLNAKSSLTYSQDFGRESRNVALSGEGFFEVKKDIKKQFTVKTGYMDITVLGTKFNVYAYQDKDIVEMSLVEGCVNIATVLPPYKNINVKPNEKVTYYKKTGELKHESTSNEAETAWMKKELVFRSEKLENVFSCLSRKFAVSFNVEDESLLDDIYTGTFEDENIESILKVLKTHYKFDYQNEDGIITIQSKKSNNL